MGYTLQFNAALTAKIKAAAGEAATTAAEHLMGAAIDKTPVETGALRASAKVTSDGTQAAVSYNTVYAARQHEEVGWSHPGGGQAKFLENAMTEEADTIRDIIAQQIRSAFT